MDDCGCDRFAIFDRRAAERVLARYRRNGPDRSTRLLLEMIRAVWAPGATVLDIGSGIGVVDHELLRSGASHAVLVDASSAQLAVARQLGRERLTLDRMDFLDGDFVALASAVEPVDVVTLDRVVCCYPDVEALVGASAARARSWYGLILPRDRWLIRFGQRVMNLWFRLRGRVYRGYAHPNAQVDALVAAAGLRPIAEASTMIWRVVLYERSA